MRAPIRCPSCNKLIIVITRLDAPVDIEIKCVRCKKVHGVDVTPSSDAESGVEVKVKSLDADNRRTE